MSIIAGIAEFALRPLPAGNDDLYFQTQQMIEKLLPEVAALNAGRKLVAAS